MELLAIPLFVCLLRILSLSVATLGIFTLRLHVHKSLVKRNAYARVVS
jgi:hypothetical protein